MNHLEIKAAITVDETGEIRGTAWPFAEPDSVGDIITKGAFLIGEETPMLLAHDPQDIIGAWRDVRETDAGLEVQGQLFVKESEKARMVRSLVKSGLITGLSIGFRAKAAVKQGRNRIISALDLLEVSLVRNPAHPGARVATVKSTSEALRVAEAINRATAALSQNKG